MSLPTTPRAAAAESDDMQSFELRRRDAYRLVFGAAAAALLPDLAAAATAGPRFLHGVASGDPARRSVVIWTRLTPDRPVRTPVDWKVATNADMTGVVASGTRDATPGRDFCVKVVVDQLQPGQTYYYQFTGPGGVTSPVGTTRTLPAANSVDPFSLLVFSCSNFEKGFFNAYAEAAKETGVFGVLHLGDYIYEYGPAGYLTPAMAPPPAGLGITDPRAGQLAPPSEITMLDAYRLRYALYRSDPNLQALHAACPWMVIYDDHESANDAWTGGAENHQPGEGPWKDRELAALRTYYDWMPLRDPQGRTYLDPATENPTSLYRAFDFGRLARLVMLDTRLAGRDEQLSGTALVAAYQNPVANDVVGGRARSLMGAAQEAWVDQQLSGSTEIWQLIGNQTLCFYENAADYLNFPGFNQATKDTISAGLDALFGPGAGAQFGALGAAGAPNPVAADSWTGYPTARARFNLSLARAANPVVLTGDSHNAWAANLRGNAGRGLQDLGVEFGGASVTSPGLEQFFFTFPASVLASLYTYSSQTKSPTDKLVYADTSRRGYMRVDVTREKVATTYVFVSTVFSTTYTVDRTTVREVAAGARKITGS